MELVYLLLIFSFINGWETVIVAKKKYRTIWNHYFFYNFLWLTLIVLSIFFNNYIYPVEPETYIVFLIQLFFFNITIWFISNKKRYIKRIKAIKLSLKKRRCIEILVLCCLLPGAILNYSLIRAGIPLYKINYEYWTQNRGTGAYLYLQFQELFLFPISLILISTIFYNYYDVKSTRSFLITIAFGIAIALCYFLISGGGRAEIMILFFVIILSLIAKTILSLTKYIRLPNKKKIAILLLLLIIVIQFANEGRGQKGNFIENAINGYIIFAPLFEYYLNSDVFSNLTYGGSMFEAIVLWIQYPFKLMDISFYDTTINDISQQFIYLPQFGKEYNNQVTACFVFMRDFGWAGLIIGPIITAWIYNFIYNLCTKNTFVFLLYFTYVLRLCGTNLNYQFNKVFIFVLIYAFIYSKWGQTKKYIR